MLLHTSVNASVIYHKLYQMFYEQFCAAAHVLQSHAPASMSLGLLMTVRSMIGAEVAAEGHVLMPSVIGWNGVLTHVLMCCHVMLLLHHQLR